MREGMRDQAYGQNYSPTFVDRFGVWLSARQIRRYTGSLAGKRLGDFGCGYQEFRLSAGQNHQIPFWGWPGIAPGDRVWFV